MKFVTMIHLIINNIDDNDDAVKAIGLKFKVTKDIF